MIIMILILSNHDHDQIINIMIIIIVKMVIIVIIMLLHLASRIAYQMEMAIQLERKPKCSMSGANPHCSIPVFYTVLQCSTQM